MANRLECIPVVRHLRDVNNLREFGTNAPLADGQGNEVSDTARTLCESCENEGYKGILFITSPTRRAVETAILIQQGVRSSEQALKTRVSVDLNIRELDQGTLNLPADYVAGSYFPPLKVAWDAFWKESFDWHDLKYHFGDPNTSRGVVYPELIDTFIKTGESYRDQCVRIYTSVLGMGRNLARFRNVMPVVVTHGAPLAIFRDLESIGHDVESGVTNFDLGKLADLTWEYYQKKNGGQHQDYGASLVVGVSSLYNPLILKRLEMEINYLKRL